VRYFASCSLLKKWEASRFFSQVIGKTGNGFSEAQKTELFALLSACPADSRYVETDSRNVAFRMIQPQLVVEIGFNDLLTESTSGEPKMNTLIDCKDGMYLPVTQSAGVSIIHPVFENIRPDKSADAVQCGIRQLAALLGDLPSASANAESLPASTVIRRALFTKGAGEKLMVQKYLVWKTNKEALDGRFPAYVLHYSDFSAGRKEMLKRELRVSSSEEQILALCDQMIAENVKKGWEPYSS
jgi:hypothetical protein